MSSLGKMKELIRYITLKKIRNKLALCFVFVIFLMSLAFSYYNYSYNSLLERYDSSLVNYNILNSFFLNNIETHAILERYFVEKSEKLYREYSDKYNKSFTLIHSLEQSINDYELIGRVIDLSRMVQTYGEKSDKAVSYLKRKDMDSAYLMLNEADTVNKLIDTSFRTYFDYQLKYSEKQRELLLKSIKQQKIFNWTIIVFAIIFCALFVWFFSRGITKPIKKLVRNAEKISKGNFDVSPVDSKSNEEISILSDTFNKMVHSVQFYLSEMEAKAKLQEKLLIEENENLRIRNLLKETQLKALQAQINPHFLFNTLNLICQTAYIENAENTLNLLESIIGLLRYNLDKTDGYVTLREEVSIINDYIFIQKMRFRDRIKFNVIIDENLNNVKIPGLIIQPLIENAVIHGVESYIKDAQIDVSIEKAGDTVIIKVKDNGVGMEKEKIKEIMEEQGGAAVKSKHSIGLNNVKKRLELFYGSDDIIKIESEKLFGTTVTLRIPANS